MIDDPPRLLVLGAHPDDAEFRAGGLIIRYRERGSTVKLVSVTNGGAGHHQRSSAALVSLRQSEAAAVAKLLDLEYEVWPFPDGALQPTLEVRTWMIAEIRRFRPDLVLTHRPCDYHPDHRAVGQAVQDASYLVTVPLVAPEVPALRVDPVVAYMTDFFTKPTPFQPDVVLDVEPEFEKIVELLSCHASQVFEWLPYNRRMLEEVPDDDEKRRAFLARWFGPMSSAVAERFRKALCSTFGETRGTTVKYAEAYEISEYAGDLDDEARVRLFPGCRPGK